MIPMGTPIYDKADKARRRRRRVQAILHSPAAHHISLALTIVFAVAVCYVLIVFAWALA